MTEARVVAVAGLGTASPSLATQIFDPEVLLTVFVLVTSLSVSGVPRLRFNGDTGTTAYAFSISDNFAAPVTGIAGAASGISLGAVNATTAFGAQITVGNGPLSSHAVFMNGFAGVTDASAAPHIITGAGVWSTTQQITSVQLDSPQGGNLGVGSGLMVVAFVQ